MNLFKYSKIDITIYADNNDKIPQKINMGNYYFNRSFNENLFVC